MKRSVSVIARTPSPHRCDVQQALVRPGMDGYPEGGQYPSIKTVGLFFDMWVRSHT
jgi:hypothetical protein